MTTATCDNRTISVVRPPVFGLYVALVLVQGCPVETGVQPDLAAIVKVVNDAYRTQGLDRPVLFLDTGEVCDSILPPCVPPEGGIFPTLKTQLETDLQVKVRPFSEADFSDPFLPALTPVLPETGEIGVSVSLGRFSVDDGGQVRVVVTVARSGLDGVFMEYKLEPANDGWIIVEARITAVA